MVRSLQPKPFCPWNIIPAALHFLKIKVIGEGKNRDSSERTDYRKEINKIRHISEKTQKLDFQKFVFISFILLCILVMVMLWVSGYSTTNVSHPLFQEALVFQSQINLLLNPYSVSKTTKSAHQAAFFPFPCTMWLARFCLLLNTLLTKSKQKKHNVDVYKAFLCVAESGLVL